MTEPTLVIVRTFPAPRSVVFRAWSSAEHMQRWFSPEHYTVPEVEIDFRTGGIFVLCMRSPAGQDHWSRGRYDEVSPPDRLAFTVAVGAAASPAFTAFTNVTFEDDGAGTRITVRQRYDIHDPACGTAVAGAPEGWRTTLDKLAREVVRLQAGAVVHDSFSLERHYDAAPAAVFRALTDQAAKDRWFGGSEGSVVLERTMDVRHGGWERMRVRHATGMVTAFEALYFDVVADRRLVYAYEMHLDGRKISVSLATMEIETSGTGSRLRVTEQGAFLDGYDDGGKRAHGTAWLLDRLGASLGG